MRFFDQMSDAAQKQYLSYNVDFIEKEPAQRESANGAWIDGDLGYYEKGVENMRKKYPDLYEALLVRRNAEWVRQIEKLLADGGTYFILVGVNHTLGPDSIQLQLKQAGVNVSPVK